MPCLDGGYDEPRRDKYEESCESLTQLLCSCVRVLLRMGYDIDENPQLSRWWSDHEKEDKRRILQEKKEKLEIDKAIAISSKPYRDLTKSEVDLLKKLGMWQY